MNLMNPSQLNRATTASSKAVGALAKKLPPPSVPKVAASIEKVAARYGLTPALVARLAAPRRR